ncbi:MAG TPA: cysteine rich repeat-containing protein [Steroidobacteraceae bacterium]|nr:cysteine rich repeat-containing protein [Steroidobacteraceae bacterium]
MRKRTAFIATVVALSLHQPATAAQSTQTDDQLAAIRAACTGDAQKLCGTVEQGGGRVLACLKDHKDSLSDRCRQAAGLPPKPTGSSAAAKHVPAPDSKAKPAPAAKAVSGPVTVAGERFVKRMLVDTQQGGMNAVAVYVPESWHFEGKIEWHYGWVEVPVNPSWHAENPANDEAYFQYESLRFVNVDVAPQYGNT